MKKGKQTWFMWLLGQYECPYCEEILEASKFSKEKGRILCYCGEIFTI